VGAYRDSGLTRCLSLENSANHDAVSKHIEIIIVPFAGRARGRCALKNERGHMLGHNSCNTSSKLPTYHRLNLFIRGDHVSSLDIARTIMMAA
jgi:hypothetical protein